MPGIMHNRSVSEVKMIKYYAKEERGGRWMYWEVGISGCKLVYTQWINKVLLYNTGNYIQYAVISHNGNEYEKECTYVCN